MSNLKSYPILSEDRLRSLDIYDLAWYAFSVITVYNKYIAREVLDEIDRRLRAYMAENEELFSMVLYDKELVAGILLGYYVILKSGFYRRDQHVERTLARILGYVNEAIDKYSSQGEVLFILKKLAEVSAAARDLNINTRLTATFEKLRNELLGESVRIEQIEDLLYLLWVLYEGGKCAFNGLDLAKMMLDDRLHNLALSDFKTRAVYANAMADFILKCKSKRMRKKDRKILRKRVEEIRTSLKRDLKLMHQIDEGVSIALVSKTTLGLYRLKKASKKLQKLDEVWKIKVRYESLTLLLMLMLVLDSYRIPLLTDLFRQFRSFAVNLMLSVVALMTIYDTITTILGDFLSKKSKLLLKQILKTLFKVFSEFSRS